MNAKQKKTIGDAISALEEVSLEDLASSIREVAGEEREAFESKGEKAQESEKGQALATALEEAASALEEAVTSIDSAKEALANLDLG